MTKPKYHITSKAVEDLKNIWLYTFNKWSIEQADRYYKLLIDEFKFLSENPNTGKSVEHIRIGYRTSIVKSHLIFYRKLSEDTIEIIRILHQKMDIDQHVKK